MVVTCPSCDHSLEFDCPDCGYSLPLETTHCPRCSHRMGDFARHRKAYLSHLGEAYRARGLLQQALSVYHYLLEIEPENPGLHIQLSELYALLEKTDESAAEAERAVELDPLNPEALSRLGHWYLNTGRHDKAGVLAARLQLHRRRGLGPHWRFLWRAAPRLLLHPERSVLQSRIRAPVCAALIGFPPRLLKVL